jgi:hypothetical protein
MFEMTTLFPPRAWRRCTPIGLTRRRARTATWRDTQTSRCRRACFRRTRRRRPRAAAAARPSRRRRLRQRRRREGAAKGEGSRGPPGAPPRGRRRRRRRRRPAPRRRASGGSDEGRNTVLQTTWQTLVARFLIGRDSVSQITDDDRGPKLGKNTRIPKLRTLLVAKNSCVRFAALGRELDCVRLLQ